ncbi:MULTISPECIES: archaellin/type IV pilin N-terminal domain-containing protein [Natrialba]|uniref:Flagellin n=2 Tax=Natrialba TaxID=63742 RepID=M0BDD7_9EURY|nr:MULTISPECIES: archaellin/type IV pilin N-terminal domain-containing protein [Natrialba]ELY89394.1 flagellin domain-containing protein [Natrialba taiwanensis DSM 12281]ELZ07649.1 flagellin domain-containing protein [Natrialba aegyptia DSM 13077]
MFETDNDHDRGQVGIGTLIVFIAMVLVAAIAAGVLINTAGMLQTQAEATGEESTDQVSDRLEIVSASGNVSDASDNNNITELNFVMAMAAGSDPIDLNKTTAQFIGSEGEETFTTDNGSGVEIKNIQGVDGAPDEAVLTETSDRVEVIVSLNEVYSTLEEGDQLSVIFTTDAGATTEMEIRVPTTITDEDSSVKL